MRANRFLTNDKGSLIPPGDIVGGGAYPSVVMPSRVSVTSQNDNGIDVAEDTRSESDRIGGFQVDVESASLEPSVSELPLSNQISLDRAVDTIKLGETDPAAQGSAKLFRKQSKISAPSDLAPPESPLVAKPERSRTRETPPSRSPNDGPKPKATAFQGGNNAILNLKNVDDNSEFGKAYYSTHMPDFSLHPPFTELNAGAQSGKKEEVRQIWKEALFSAAIASALILALLGVRLLSQDNAYEILSNYTSELTQYADQFRQSVTTNILPNFMIAEDGTAPETSNQSLTMSGSKEMDNESISSHSTGTEGQNDQPRQDISSTESDGPSNQFTAVRARDQNLTETIPNRDRDGDAMPGALSKNAAHQSNTLEQTLNKLGSTKCVERGNQIVEKLSLGNFATLLQKPLGHPDNSLLLATLLPKDDTAINNLSFVSAAPNLEHGCEGQYESITIIDKPCRGAIAELFADAHPLKLRKSGMALIGLNEFVRVFALPVANSCVFIRQELLR